MDTGSDPMNTKQNAESHLGLETPASFPGVSASSISQPHRRDSFTSPVANECCSFIPWLVWHVLAFTFCTRQCKPGVSLALGNGRAVTLREVKMMRGS